MDFTFRTSFSCFYPFFNYIKEEYQKLRGKPLARSQKATQSQDTSKKDQGHCFCQRTYKLVHNVPMLQCNMIILLLVLFIYFKNF